MSKRGELGSMMVLRSTYRDITPQAKATCQRLQIDGQINVSISEHSHEIGQKTCCITNHWE